ncbi:MAG TPA: DUF262 domain-containing protein [Thermoanaerobaculales bacterium]|nr:DUF262 domain-containing protein [Thermoanaerobaculales bacterium]
MPSIFEDTNPRELKELLGLIYSSDAALPDFQRDFVWDPNATQELIVSIAHNYPAGSLLRIRNTHSYFACREFQGAPALNKHQPTYLVLDGQQRLTSLYQAFYGVGDHRYYLDLRGLLNGLDFEECIFHLREKAKRSRALQQLEVQARDLILPLSVLQGGNGDFNGWTIDVATRLENEQNPIDVIKQLKQIGTDWIQTIDDYQFPVVTLSDTTGAEAVCTIFETLNRTGVKLSVFELLTARFWPQDVNLRELWDGARNRCEKITDFEVDPYYLLQMIALTTREHPACKRSDVLALDVSAINKWWGIVVDGLDLALDILNDDCGVLVPKWLPYYSMLIPMGAALARAASLGTTREGADRLKLRKWFWCSVFGQKYERAANSQCARDYGELVRWFEGGQPPDSVTAFRFDPRVLLDTTPRQRALYRGVIALVLAGGSRDFHSVKKITAKMIADQQIDDHHIFPQAWSNAHGKPARLRDCVLNRTLIDRATNQRIGARAPSDYLKEITKALEDVKPKSFKTLMDSHLINADDGSPLKHDDFEGFLDQRLDAIWDRIRDVTGATEASDLMAEGNGS